MPVAVEDRPAMCEKSDKLAMSNENEGRRAEGIPHPAAAGAAPAGGQVQVLWGGRLRYNHQDYDCRVLAISLGGVKVSVGDPVAVPSPVTLRLERFGEFLCKVAWRAGDHLGLDFVDPPERIAETIGAAVPALQGPVRAGAP